MSCNADNEFSDAEGEEIEEDEETPGTSLVTPRTFLKRNPYMGYGEARHRTPASVAKSECVSEYMPGESEHDEDEVDSRLWNVVDDDNSDVEADLRCVCMCVCCACVE